MENQTLATPPTENIAPSTKPAAPSLSRQLLQCLMLVLLSAGSYLFISHFCFQSVQVVGVSMVPTLRPADQLILDRLTYRFHAPKQNDIVVIKDPTDGAFVVKRIIGMPGDSILFKNGKVFVNGVQLKEPYVWAGRPTLTYSGFHEQLIVCGQDQYFVLGDNRENSFDSRMYGPVRRQNILGAVHL